MVQIRITDIVNLLFIFGYIFRKKAVLLSITEKHNEIKTYYYENRHSDKE